MSYSEHFFQKTLDKLFYEDLVSFFSVVHPENDRLECKSHHPSTTDDNIYNHLKKAVCGFLNSEGGILIWGAPKDGDTLLTPIEKLHNKDKLVSIVSDGIIPLPKSFRVQPVKKADEDKWLYVFEVEKSPYSPHQTLGQYFMRMDGKTKVAPHHYVEALFKQVRYPNLIGYLNFQDFYRGSVIGRSGYVLILDILILNVSININEKNSFYILKFPENGCIDLGTSQFVKGIKREVFYDSFHYGVGYKKNIEIFIPERDYNVHQGAFDIKLMFGGELSPIKICHYFLNLTNADRHDLFKTIVANYYENEMASDLDSKHGLDAHQIILGELKR